MLATSFSVALAENGRWYAMRLDTLEQPPLLPETFLSFRGIDSPAPQLVPLDE